MTSSNKFPATVIANDGEWNKHRCKWQKRRTSKLSRQGAKKAIRRQDY